MIESSPPCPADTPPGPPSALDPLLAAWLSSGRPACPRCGYDVSAARRPQCPECGFTLRLRVGVADPATLPWTLVLILLALPVGMGSLMTVGGMLHGWSRGRSRSVDEEFVRLGLVTLPPLVAWVLVRRWFVRLEPRWRRVVLVIFALIAVTGCRMGMVAA